MWRLFRIFGGVFFGVIWQNCGVFQIQTFGNTVAFQQNPEERRPHLFLEQNYQIIIHQNEKELVRRNEVFAVAAEPGKQGKHLLPHNFGIH